MVGATLGIATRIVGGDWNHTPEGSPHVGAISSNTNLRYASMKRVNSGDACNAANALFSSPGRIASAHSLGIFQPACRNACISLRYRGGSGGSVPPSPTGT